TDAGGGIGSARDGGRRQVAVAGSDRHPFGRHAQNLGGHAGGGRADAGAKLVAGGFDRHPAIGRKLHPGGGGGDVGGVDGGGTAHADHPVAIAHRPRHRVAPV